VVVARIVRQHDGAGEAQAEVGDRLARHAGGGPSRRSGAPKRVK
jgi:hypothetical protein